MALRERRSEVLLSRGAVLYFDVTFFKKSMRFGGIQLGGFNLSDSQLAKCVEWGNINVFFPIKSPVKIFEVSQVVSLLQCI